MVILKEINVPEWKKENVIEWLVGCRMDEGLPIFVTKYAGTRFKVDDKPAVMAKCNFGRDKVGSMVFTNVPKEDVEELERKIGDWRHILERWGTKEEKEKAYSKGIYISGARLPKIVKR